MSIERLGAEVVYNEERWRLLREKRAKALLVMSALRLQSYVFGSVARGDVDNDSDIDIIIPDPVPPYLVEFRLEAAGLRAYGKEIVQATPSYVPKAYIYLDPDEEVVVSFPLARPRPREQSFYKWGGIVDAAGISRGLRVPGVSKDLTVIVPTERGHVEFPVLGHEAEAARVVGVELDVILEREQVLGRRREMGRTGTFLDAEVPPDQPLEEVIRELAKRNEFFRRSLVSRQAY